MKITSTITLSALAHCVGIQPDAILRCNQIGVGATGGVRYVIETTKQFYMARYYGGSYERIYSGKRPG